MGAGATGVFFKKKYEKIANEEIENMKAYYKVDDIQVLEEEDRSEEIKEMASKEGYLKPISDEKSDLDSAVRPRSGEKTEAEKVDYTQFYAVNNPDPAEEESPNEDEDDSNYYEGLATTKKMQKPKNVKLIKAEEFGLQPGFECITLEYYTEDDLLVTDDAEEVEDVNIIESMIGDALTKYGFKDNDEQVIYVRNYNYGCDYEIVKVVGPDDGGR